MDIKTQMIEIVKKYYIISNRKHNMIIIPTAFYWFKKEEDYTTIYFSPRTYDLTDQQAEKVVEKIPYELWLSVVQDFEKYMYRSKVTK